MEALICTRLSALGPSSAAGVLPVARRTSSRDHPGVSSPWRAPVPLQLSKEIDMTTQTGTVKWFNDGKGFGFIKPDDGGKDLFAHFKEIQGGGFKTLTENQRVQFEVTQGQKGPQASNIRDVG